LRVHLLLHARERFVELAQLGGEGFHPGVVFFLRAGLIFFFFAVVAAAGGEGKYAGHDGQQQEACEGACSFHDTVT
jgi:hypothetical protein